ncbi:hypothetical protein E8E15_009209 [Penicillium rubens]|nr:hypothetical protein E8E15_009209 [Penicillium rubens]
MEASLHINLDYFACGCWNLPSIMIIALRIYLSQENKRRDKLAEANRVASNGVVETVDSDGGKVARIVDNTDIYSDW